jgi:hypothetical protein
MHLLNVNRDKVFPLLEPLLSWSSYEMKLLVIIKSAQVGSMMIKLAHMWMRSAGAQPIQ